MGEDKVHRLEQLYAAIQDDRLYRTGKMGGIFVPGSGSAEKANMVLVGEAPGREEEKQQKPFVGPAGKNLNALMERIDLSREQVFITNLLKYRPLTPDEGNRSPSLKECRRALPYLLRELDILAPEVVVCLGLSSAKALLENPGLKMTAANGHIFHKHGFAILVTYHPSPLNYMMPEKREAMENAFRVLRDRLATGGSSITST